MFENDYQLKTLIRNLDGKNESNGMLQNLKFKVIERVKLLITFKIG